MAITARASTCDQRRSHGGDRSRERASPSPRGSSLPCIHCLPVPAAVVASVAVRERSRRACPILSPRSRWPAVSATRSRSEERRVGGGGPYWRWAEPEEEKEPETTAP